MAGNDSGAARRARAADMIRSAESRGVPRFSAFLDESEQAAMAAALRGASCAHRFYGGFEGASRRVLGVFPAGTDIPDAAFPVRAFRAAIPRGIALSHRDFLGAILALGIKREVVGDILIEGDSAFFFVLPQACALIEGELRQVGRAGVRISPACLENIQWTQRFEESDRTVTSMRLDGVVAALADVSRAQAARLVESGYVAVNGAPCEKITRTVAGGDRLSIRGKGKFVVESGGRTTRKGRMVIHCKKYL